jgi:hypothetical protein
MDYPQPLVTVDAVLLTLREGQLQVALHKRPAEPFAEMLALPGGILHVNEDVSAETAILRVLTHKTGFKPRYIEQLRVFSGPERDPRSWSISIAYVALAPEESLAKAKRDVFHFYSVDHLPQLAFDHNAIISAAVLRLRSKTRYSTLPTQLLPNKFTLGQLQATYEYIIGHKLNKAAFRRKIENEGVVIATDEYTQGGAHRPAQLYRARSVELFDRTIA